MLLREAPEVNTLARPWGLGKVGEATLQRVKGEGKLPTRRQGQTTSVGLCFSGHFSEVLGNDRSISSIVRETNLRLLNGQLNLIHIARKSVGCGCSVFSESPRCLSTLP